MICKGDFQACLLALSGDHFNSDPFLDLFYQNSDANKIHKVPYLPFFDFWSNMGLCPLFQSPLFGVSTVLYLL